MILIDTSLLADHFRAVDPVVAALLAQGDVICHPFVIGEIMMGNPRNRHGIAELLNRLPQLPIASDSEVLDFVERHSLFGTGLGYVDAHLLAAARLTRGTTVWTRDRQMAKAAEHLSIFANGMPKLQ